MLRNKRVVASLAEQLFVSHAGLGLILVAHQSLFHTRTQSKARLLLDIRSRHGVKKYAETRVQGGHSDKECDSLNGSNKSTALFAASSGNSVQMFRDNLSVPSSSWVKNHS